MLKYVFYGLLVFAAPFLIMLLTSLPNPWLYLIPLAVAVAGVVIETRKPPRTR